MRASAIRPLTGWLGLLAVVMVLSSCAFTFDQPPPQFGFFSSSQPWTLIPGVAESFRGEMMWGGVSDSAASSTVSTIAPDAAGVFSIWVYSDASPGSLTIHLAVGGVGDDSLSYSVGTVLEPIDTSYSIYRGMRKVKRYDFYATDETYRLIAEHQDREYQGVLVLNSPQQGLALIRLDRSGRRRSSGTGAGQQAADGGGQTGVGGFEPPHFDLPEPPETELPLPPAVEFGYPVIGYGAGTYKGRIFGAKNPGNTKLPFHIGEDVAIESGTAVKAVADGTVVRSGKADRYGVVVVVEHVLTDGTILNSIYGHLSDRDGFKAIAGGREVTRGQTVGYVGWDDLYPAGDSDENGDGGPHLHMGIRVVGRQRDYTPGEPGYWYRGYGTAADMGQLDRRGNHTGGPYISFTDLMRYSYRGLTTAARSGTQWDMQLD